MGETTITFYAEKMKGTVKYALMLPILLALSFNAYSQNGNNTLYFWKFHAVSGEARLNGLYREQERTGRDFNEYQKSAYLSGGLMLNAQSSILHQNFLMLNLNAGYFPETSRDNFIVVPDQSEVRTTKKLGFDATFLKQKKITLNAFGNYDESYSSREYLTDIRSVSRIAGAELGYSNSYLPLTMKIQRRSWDEEEIKTGRKYSLDQKLFEARLSGSFSKRGKSELNFSHDENVNVNQNLLRVASTIDHIEFYNSLYLNSGHDYNLITRVSDFIQSGNSDLNRFQASEYLQFQLPLNLSLYSNYNFYNITQQSGDLKQHSVNSSLGHKLYKSLQSGINLDVNSIEHSVYKEFNTKAGIELNYSKKIPTGQFMMSYRFDRYHQDYTSDPVKLEITNEQYTLSDSKIVLIRLPDVHLSSVVVRDVTTTLTYQNGLDYILIERNRYIEIRRIPGGAIADNGPVFIDYTANQPGSYSYDANAHVFTSGIYLLNSLLSLNYRFSTQDYSNLDRTEFVTLNYYTQHVFGFRLDFKFIIAGAEYEDYKSSILPYKMLKYYVNFQKNLGSKATVMLNWNMQDYKMLDEPVVKYQKYMDLTGRVTYSIFRQTSFNTDVMYRKQTGRGIELNLLTARSEITSSVNRLYFSLGIELYRRNYVGERINFKGCYAKIVRKF